MSPQIEKAQFRNETEGWVGAVTIGPKNDERGVAVAPGETIWLSEQEQILTANAPRKPEDNPFIPQTRIKVDPLTGERAEITVTPLVRASEERFVPSSARPIPGEAGTPDAPPADPVLPPHMSGNTPADQVVASLPEAETPAEVVPAPPLAPEAPQEAAPAPDPTPASPEAPVAAEETAAQSPGPQVEETGAALAPSSEAPEGEYAAMEEVGTPGAPQADAPAPAPLAPSNEE